ncbi:hypothetical protein [Bacillus cereus]|uniref:hypothetical protein n=1 Tax=Bacillus cereus TaxID=1396 RepID=UPI001F21721D|nr:hypothetical protein [Bacillus cereus]
MLIKMRDFIMNFLNKIILNQTVINIESKRLSEPLTHANNTTDVNTLDSTTSLSFSSLSKKAASLMKSTLKVSTKTNASKTITKINITSQEVQHHHIEINVMIQRLQLHIGHLNTQNISLYSIPSIGKNYTAKKLSEFVKHKLLSETAICKILLIFSFHLPIHFNYTINVYSINMFLSPFSVQHSNVNFTFNMSYFDYVFYPLLSKIPPRKFKSIRYFLFRNVLMLFYK